MGERSDLLAICKLLNINDINNDQTDIELLKAVLSTLNSSHNSNKQLQLLDKSKLPDSLAFPETIRCNNNLQEKTELWNELKQFQDLLRTDYSCRRQMLINRLDCTIESFKWKASDLAKSNNATDKNDQSQKEKSLNDIIHEKYEQPRMGLKKDPDVTMSHLLALRETECDILLNGVVSSTKFDCQVAYNKQKHQQSDDLVNLKQIIIPDVPDRGGRTGEIRPPVRETFPRQRRARGRGNWRR